MKIDTRNHYRVRESSSGTFYPEYRFWWLPVWFKTGDYDSASTVERAEEICLMHAEGPKYLGRLP